MRKYIWAFLITIPIMLLAWDMVDSTEEPPITYNDTVEESESNQTGILQGADGISLEVIDYYSSGYYGDSEWGWFHSTTGETTEDESERIEFEDEDVPWEMQDDYMTQVKELDLTFFEEKK